MRKRDRTFRMAAKDKQAYKKYLEERESAPATVEKYMGALDSFFEWLEDRRITKETEIG